MVRTQPHIASENTDAIHSEPLTSLTNTRWQTQSTGQPACHSIMRGLTRHLKTKTTPAVQIQREDQRLEPASCIRLDYKEEARKLINPWHLSSSQAEQ